MNYLEFALKEVKEPPLNTIVFNFQNGIIFPCIVKSGQFYAENGRLSNFWYWINLLTCKEEHGYGTFFVRLDCDVAEQNKGGE